MRITMKGFKAVDRELVVSRLTAITAPNGTGKSAIADAIRFVALGYVPALGKTLAATASLMSGHELSVEIEFPDGSTASRGLKRVGEKLTSSVHASWVKGSPAEHEAAIAGLFGAEAQDVAEALDIRVLLSETPAKRAARIESMLGTVSAEEQLSRVARLTIARLLDTDEEKLPEDHRECYQVLPPGRLPILRDLAPTLQAHLVDSGLPACVGWINETKRESETNARKRRQGLTELQSRMGGLRVESKETIAELEACRATLQRKLGAIEQHERSEETRRVRLDATLKERATAEKNLADGEAELARIRKRRDEMVPAFAEKADDLADQILAAKQQKRAAPANDELTKIEEELAGMVLEPVEDLARAVALIAQREQQLAGMIESPWAEVKAIAEDLREHYGKNRGCERLIELADENGANSDPERQQLERMRESLAEREHQRDQVLARNAEREARRDTLIAQRDELLAANSDARASHEAWQKRQATEVERLTKMRETAIQKIEEQNSAVDQQKKHVEELRGKLTAVCARINELELSHGAEGDVGELSDEIERIDGQLKTLNDRATLSREIAAIEAEVDRLEATVDVAKAIEWSLQRVREEELNRRQGGLVGIIDEFLAGAGRTERPYMEVARNLCSLGWVRNDGRQVDVSAMSGGEWSLFSAALTAAVIIQHAAKLRVLLVEAGECDDAMLHALQSGVGAVSDRLSYAIVLTPHHPFNEVDGWSTMKLDQEVASVE